MARQTTDREDQIIQSALLVHVLALHPTALTEDDVLRELAGEQPEDFGQQDAVRRAVRDLTSVGLLHRNGGFILPSQAALRAYELWEA